jgi:hypothetical protein
MFKVEDVTRDEIMEIPVLAVRIDRAKHSLVLRPNELFQYRVYIKIRHGWFGSFWKNVHTTNDPTEAVNKANELLVTKVYSETNPNIVTTSINV